MAKNTIEVFFLKIKKTDTCWLWIGKPHDDGYGQFRYNGKQRRAHVVSWEYHNNAIVRSGFCVLHKCDVPLCVNPDHLFLGTRIDNNIDKCMKNRQAKGRDFPQARLSEDIVIQIRKERQEGALCSDLGKKYKVHPNHIGDICKRKKWKHVSSNLSPH